jgi:exodeoxyribonuclease VII large subunit
MLENILELSVSDLSNGIKRLIEENFGYVRVRGEISGFRGASPSGHVYFRLKDENALIEAVIWKGNFNKLKFKPQEGLEMIATGKVTTFGGSSKYQIVIENLEPAGAGALMAMLEERKKKLVDEGLFDAAHKQPLPFMPRVIGVVTSPTGAVIRDILHRVADRFPLHVIVWPVRVQGEAAAGEITAAINGFQNFTPRPDVLIVARGGGSLEDLWCFNEENVVRAAFASKIPLISAVGHETDTTLIDYASDIRAPTPTAAAELAVPVRKELVQRVAGLDTRQSEAIQRVLKTCRFNVTSFARALPTLDKLLALPRQKLDSLSERLPLALKANALKDRLKVNALATRLTTRLLSTRVQRENERVQSLESRLKLALKTSLRENKIRIERGRERVTALHTQMKAAFTRALEAKTRLIAHKSSLLIAFSYQNTLKRGFALVRDKAGNPLTRASQLTPNLPLILEFQDAKVEANVKPTKPSQTSLF